MSVVNPNHSPYRATGRPAQQPKNQGQHLSPGWRAEKILISPLAGVGQGLISGVKAGGVAGGFVTTFAATKHPILATLTGLGSLVGVPLYATAKGLCRFFSNIKAGITGHTAPKN